MELLSVDKEKALRYIGTDAPIAPAGDNKGAISAAKIHQNLQTTKRSFANSQKSTTFVPTSKVPKEELAVAHQSLFAAVQDHAEEGTLYYINSANYTHLFNGSRHIGAIEINGNEELIKSLEKGIDNGTYQDAADLNRWNESIGSREEYDNRTNAPAQRQRGGNEGVDILHQGQPTDTEPNQPQSNGNSRSIPHPLRTPDGVVYGYARNGKIYLTARGLNPNTPIHEYTHLWVAAVRNRNAELYANLQDLFSRANLPDMWAELDRDPHYAHLSDEAKLSEIISRFSGKQGAARMEEEAQKHIDAARRQGKKPLAEAISLRERMRNLLQKLWHWVGENLFHIQHLDSREEVADRILYDLLNATDLGEPTKDDTQTRFSVASSPVPPKMQGETTREWAVRIADRRKQQIEQQQVEQYKQLLTRNQSHRSKLYQLFVDKFTALDNFQQWVQAQGGTFDPDTMDMHGDISLSMGRIETFSDRYKDLYIQSIADTIAAIEKNKALRKALQSLDLRWQNFEDERVNGKPLTTREIMGVYAKAKDTEEAKRQGLADRGAQGFVNNLGMTYDELINAVEGALPQENIDAFWDAVYAANQFALDYQLAAGMIDQATRNRYTRRYYVPRRGWRERDFDGIDTNYVQDGSTHLYGNPYNTALVKARGRQSLASDPFALIESIGLTSIRQSEHNKSKQQLLNLLLANENIGLKSGAWTVRQIWAKNVIDPATGRIMLKPDGTPIEAEVTYAAPTLCLDREDTKFE